MEESLSMDQVFIKKLTDIVLANLANENFGAEDLAKEAGMSRGTLYRKLRSIKHQDVIQFIREVRLQRALEMLRNNEGTVSEISFRVGFASHAYFTKCFHEYYGYPPGEVRKGVSEISEVSALRSKEEKPHDNLNNTLYKDQVNIVGKTIKDILYSLIDSEPTVVETTTEPTSVDEKPGAKQPFKKKALEIPTVTFLYRFKNLLAFSKRTWRIIALVCIIVSVGSIWLYLNEKPSSPDRALTRYDIPLADYIGRTGRKELAISPDGEYLVYAVNDELYLIQLNSDAPSQPISGSTNSRNIFFSPDSKWIGFENWAERKIMKIPLTGGNPVTICNLEGGTYGGIHWHGKEIIFGERNVIYRVSDGGGKPERLYPFIKSGNGPIVRNHQLLPDKKTLLFSQQLEDGGWSIVTWRLGSDESPVVMVEGGSDGRYLNSGHLAYSLNNLLYICKFNPRTNRIISERQIIATIPSYNPSQFDFSENGILVYYEFRSSTLRLRNLVWADEDGKVTPITREAKSYYYTAISSDAQNIAVSVNTGEIANPNYRIEIMDTKIGNSTLFAENANWPVWSADNASIIYVSTATNNQVFQKPIDGTTPPVLLFELDSATGIELENLSRDGRYLPLAINKRDGFDIGYYDMRNGKVEMLEYYNSEAIERWLSISPDGKWLAYLSDKEGGLAIYVVPFPGPGQPTKVTLSQEALHINWPIWSRDMTALYYRDNRDYQIRRIKINISDHTFSYEPGPSFFKGSNKFVTEQTANVEINPIDNRFLLIQWEFVTREALIEPRIKVIVNWEQELVDN